MTVDEVIAALPKLKPDELELIRHELYELEMKPWRERCKQPLPEGATLASIDGLDDLVGCIDDLPEDLAVNLDHYLYGMPKQY